MLQKELVEKYFTFIDRQGLWTWRSQRNLRRYLHYLFKGTCFQDKKMLDIGGGSGFFVFYGACMGANRAVCLEPQAAGSDGGAIETFAELQSGLPEVDQVDLKGVTFQDFDPQGERFDVILLHNSINHLDEQACRNLHRDPGAIATYRDIFGKLGDLAGDGARLIIADCSRYNLLGLLGIRNPAAPHIDWRLHQPASLWARLLSEHGFCNPRIRYASFSQLGTIGRLLLGNRIASFCLTSHFSLTMDKTQ